MMIHICRQCGQEFYRKGRGPAYFCNHKCYGLARINKPSPHRLPEGNSFGKGGFRPDIGIYVRSRWEANYARYLHHLRRVFVYEPGSFPVTLADGSVHMYHPDFLVDTAYYVEIKGWTRPERRQAEVIKAAQSQLPMPLYVIRSTQYRLLERTVASKIKEWEYARDNLPPKPERFCPTCNKRIIGIFRRRKFCSIKCYAASRPKEALTQFLKGGEKTRYQPGHTLGSIGGKASAAARFRRRMSL